MIKDNVILEDSTLSLYIVYNKWCVSNGGNMQESGCRNGNVAAAALESARCLV